MSLNSEAATGSCPPATPAELRSCLGPLSRGLSALFWGLPITLVISVQTLTLNRLGNLGLVSTFAPTAGFGLLGYGLLLLGRFRPRDPAWTGRLDRTRLLALTNFGLSPFLHWHHRVPEADLFATAVGLLALFSILFLLTLNGTLRGLALATPDSLLQLETLTFTRLNTFCLVLLPALAVAWMAALRWETAPFQLRLFLQTVEPFRFLTLLFLTLLPLSITMSLLWKTKETIISLATQSPPHQDAEPPSPS